MAVLIGLFVYRDMSLSKLRDATLAAAETTGSIVLILQFSFLIGRILVSERVPQELTEWVASIVTTPVAIMITDSAALVILGAILEDVTITVVVAPLLLALMQSVGVEPVHFAVILATSVVIGANIPPMAPLLFLACRISKVSVQHAIAPALAGPDVIG